MQHSFNASGKRLSAGSVNMMFCSVGRRVRLLRDAKESLGHDSRIVAVDGNATAPALFCGDRQYVVPRIDDPDYIDTILQIAKENDVKVITTLIDPEIELLARNRQRFLDEGILPLCPSEESARYCFNKYELFKHLQANGIRTVPTYHSLDDVKKAVAGGELSLPVFMKPVCGSGSVGAHKVCSVEALERDWNSGDFDYIVQEFMQGGDCDADVYVDCVSNKAVAAFSKRKIETRIGGASKTISFKDEKLFLFIREIVEAFRFYGPLDMDFFVRDGEYFLSEINPRFGGAYPHAYGAGVDFFQLIANNVRGIANGDIVGDYDEDVLMMMYDDVVIAHKSELLNDDFKML